MDGVTWAYFTIPSLKLQAKDLIMIPELVALALQVDNWIVRSDIIWSKPNPMPESVTDRPTKAHEYLFLLSKRPKYYYDSDAIREPIKDVTLKRLSQPNFENQKGGPKDTKTGNRSERRTLENLKERYTKQGVWDERQEGYANWDKSGGRNKRTVWTIATAPYSGAHFATYPPALVEPCIKAGTSEYGVCQNCGAPWERVVEKKFIATLGGGRRNMTGQELMQGWEGVPRGSNDVTTLGFRPTCTCPAADPVPAIVLDPFAGSGTTLLVARKLGRRGVGLDLSYSYLHNQARERLGLTALDAWTNGSAVNDNGYHDLPMFSEVTE
jgi:DNA modification methylase